MEILKSFKSVVSILVYLLIAAGFFALIRFEILYGVAGGKFGGADVHTMPGTFGFLIWIQALLGLHLVTESIKDVWILFHGSNKKSGQDSPERIIAIYWLLATFALLILNLLAAWSAFEMLSNVYHLMDEIEMPKKAILGGLFLIVFGVMCSVYYNFLLRTLIDELYPKARISFQILRRNNK